MVKTTLMIDNRIRNSTYGCAAPLLVPLPNNNILYIERRPRSGFIPENIWVTLTDQTVRGMRNHIIPYETLRNFYNAAINRDRNLPGELRIFSEFFLHLLNNARSRYSSEASQLNNINRASQVAELMRRGSINSLTNSDNISINQSRGIMVIQTMYAWMPGCLDAW